jgi:hypothetical protein
MCDKDKAKAEGCEKPSECKGHPQECTSEQTKKCHGDAKEHPCVKPAGSK